MRRSIRTGLVFSFVLPLLASPALAETVYGKGVGRESAQVSVADLFANPDRYVGKFVRVEGSIRDVCPMRGCWIDIARDTDTGSEAVVRFKVPDGEIVFPADSKGRAVAAEGTFARIDLSEEEALGWARHLAEERGEAFDPGTADVPRVIYRIDGTGAVVR